MREYPDDALTNLLDALRLCASRDRERTAELLAAWATDPTNPPLITVVPFSNSWGTLWTCLSEAADSVDWVPQT
jgi:hypothetical protein